MTIYGYARVSGPSQNLEDQINQLKEAGCTIIYSEKITGKKKDRPELQKLLSVLIEGDTIIFTKMDRFARTAEDAISLIKQLFERGVRVNILNMGVIENTTGGILMLTILSAFAEFERSLLIERFESGKEYAKSVNPNYKEGRKNKYSKVQLEHAMVLLKENSYTQVERLTGISKATLVRYKQKMKTQS